LFFPTLDSIATRDVLTIDFTATIEEAIDKMDTSNHRNIIVTDKTVYYVLTTVDLITLKLENVDFTRPLSSLDLKQVPTLPENENVINAINIINKEHEYICIVDVNGHLRGIVTNSDIVASVDPQIMLENTSLSTLFESRYSYSIVQTDEPMSRAIEVLRESLKDCLIIAHGKELVGILTSKDILHYFKEDAANEHQVSEFMSTPLHTLPVETSIKEALAFVKEKHFKRIVVIDADGGLVGIVSQQDLISQTYLRWSNLIKEHYNEIEELSHILEQQNKQLVKMATKDRLTGANNRHMFEEQFEKEHAYARRYNIPLHLMIFDIDHFKRINDTYGHIIGDSVLRVFSGLIQGHARSSDIFARWGGEEFVLLLHNSDDDNAYNVADKLRRFIHEYEFDKVGHVTCSIGMSRIDPELTLNENFSRADEALYLSKSQGRNTVSFYGQEAL
jgi:diguanylate cyclase (GGDEF)-like protein